MPINLRVMPVVVLSAVVSGCVTIDPTGRVSSVAGEEALVAYDGGAFTPDQQAHLRFADLWQVEEIATFRGDDQIIQVWFGAAHRDQPVALMPNKSVSDFTQQWSALDGEVTFNGDFDRMSASGRVYDIRDFTTNGGKRQCFAFATEYDDPTEDRQRRPGAVAYGYYCAADAKPLTKKNRYRALVGLITPLREPETEAWRTGGTAQALNAAQAQLAAFPFGYGHAFSTADGENID